VWVVLSGISFVSNGYMKKAMLFSFLTIKKQAMQTLKMSLGFLKATALQRKEQQAVKGGGVNAVFYYCSLYNECFPSLFQCSKGCGGAGNCTPRQSNLCP
jgi:hypothetical protein